VKVHFARTRSVIPNSCVPAMAELLEHQRRQHGHLAVEDPDEADVLVFPDCHLVPRDWKLREVAASEAGRRFPDKITVYDERDTPWCRFPGIYVSMPATHFASRWQVAAGYYRVDDPAARLDVDPSAIDRDLLCSFVGGPTHRCRDAVLRLEGPRLHIESTAGFVFYDPTSDRFAERRRGFAEILFRSKFVLCPRGAGTSSIRLYEAMAAGRAPVIISDGWMPPSGPRWDQFSLRWPEDRVAELPGVLEEAEPDADAMGARARAAYEEWFAPDVALSAVLDQLEVLRRSSGYPGFPASGRRDAQFLHAGAARANGEYHALRGAVGRRLRGS
jgi:hypothetical protein